MGEIRSVCKFSIKNIEERENLGNLNINGRIILKYQYSL
jgi:hypothetical protein